MILLNYCTTTTTIIITTTITNYYPSDSSFTCDLAATMPAEVFFVHVGIIIYRTGYSVIMPSLVHTKVCKRDKIRVGGEVRREWEKKKRKVAAPTLPMGLF